jgi:hypothetical protein
MTQMCACGKPLHYTDPNLQAQIQSLVDKLGETVDVSVGRSWYKIPRHYIALHGLNARDIPQLAEELGFEHGTS